LLDLLQMNDYLLPTALIGSIALVSYISPAVALSPVEVQRIAQQTTVQIVGCDFGSGAIVQKNGNTYKVLTVAHGTRQSGCEILAPDDRRYQVTQVNTFPNNDLAVVSFNSSKNYPVAKLIDNSDRVDIGETIYVSGFLLSTARSKSVFTFVKGDVVSNSTKQQDRGYSLIYSHQTFPGNSGGPVWNDRGEVIAMQGRGDVATKQVDTTNAAARAKTGFDLGITVNTFTTIATNAGIKGFSPSVIAARPKPVDDLIASAIQKERQGDYQGMLADLDRAIFLDSQTARLYYTRGVAKSVLGNRDAIGDYNQAISLNLNEANVYNNRGISKFDLGDRQGAIADFDRAIALDVNYASPYYHRGSTRAALNSPAAALSDLNKAISLDPKLAPAYLSRGNVKAMLGDPKGELADFDRAIALDPQYTEAYYKRGLAKSTAGDRKGAIEDFNRTITLNPKAAEPYNDRGNAKSALGDTKGAIADFTSSIALDTSNARAYANRGLVKAKLGDKKGAILDLKKAANRFKLQRQTASYQRVISEIERIAS
jgi:tetratricopeptide (TPR) repeat protein